MGTDCGVCGAFGLYLPHFKELEPLYTEFKHAVDDWFEKHDDVFGPIDFLASDESSDWFEKFEKALAEIGIVLPSGCDLIYTGSESDRPARCDTPSDEFIIGFGMLAYPWDWEGSSKWPKSFKDNARWHTRVWMG